MRSAKFFRLVIPFALLLFLQLACLVSGAPVRSIPEREKFIEIYQAPEILDKNEPGSFMIKTNPGNPCFGVVIYDSTKQNGVEEIDLPELDADDKGICNWSWTVPQDAVSGTAVFRAAAEQDGIHDSIMPYSFCIEKCPWGAP